MTVSIQHQLSQEEALTRVKGLITKLKQEQAGRITSSKENWNDNTGNFEFTAMGYTIAGTTSVNSSTVDIDANLPFALTFFKGAIQETISKQLNELLKP